MMVMVALGLVVAVTRMSLMDEVEMLMMTVVVVLVVESDPSWTVTWLQWTLTEDV